MAVEFDRGDGFGHVRVDPFVEHGAVVNREPRRNHTPVDPAARQDLQAARCRQVAFDGSSPCNALRDADVLDTLRRIWHERPETARRVRQRISAVMDWAIAMQYRTDSGPLFGTGRVWTPP